MNLRMTKNFNLKGGKINFSNLRRKEAKINSERHYFKNLELFIKFRKNINLNLFQVSDVFIQPFVFN